MTYQWMRQYISTASDRTARKGEEGTAITLVSYGEMSNFNNIKALTKTKIEEIRSSAPSSDDSPIKSFF